MLNKLTIINFDDKNYTKIKSKDKNRMIKENWFFFFNFKKRLWTTNKTKTSLCADVNRSMVTTKMTAFALVFPYLFQLATHSSPSFSIFSKRNKKKKRSRFFSPAFHLNHGDDEAKKSNNSSSTMPACTIVVCIAIVIVGIVGIILHAWTLLSRLRYSSLFSVVLSIRACMCVRDGINSELTRRQRIRSACARVYWCRVR